MEISRIKADVSQQGATRAMYCFRSFQNWLGKDIKLKKITTHLLEHFQRDRLNQASLHTVGREISPKRNRLKKLVQENRPLVAYKELLDNGGKRVGIIPVVIDIKPNKVNYYSLDYHSSSLVQNCCHDGDLCPRKSFNLPYPCNFIKLESCDWEDGGGGFKGWNGEEYEEEE